MLTMAKVMIHRTVERAIPDLLSNVWITLQIPRLINDDPEGRNNRFAHMTRLILATGGGRPRSVPGANQSGSWHAVQSNTSPQQNESAPMTRIVTYAHHPRCPPRKADGGRTGARQ